MKPTRLVLVLGLLTVTAPAALAQTALSDQGVHFPDGTLQATAAGTVEAWPQQCATSSSGVAPGSEVWQLTCHGFGGGPGWNSTNGVPDGYYFLVTDVVITPLTIDDTGEARLLLYHIGDCDDGVPQSGNGLMRALWFRLVGDTRTLSTHYEAPAIVLPPGGCLRYDAASDNTMHLAVQVNGYLTTDPSKFHP